MWGDVQKITLVIVFYWYFFMFRSWYLDCCGGDLTFKLVESIRLYSDERYISIFTLTKIPNIRLISKIFISKKFLLLCNISWTCTFHVLFNGSKKETIYKYATSNNLLENKIGFCKKLYFIKLVLLFYYHYFKMLKCFSLTKFWKTFNLEKKKRIYIIYGRKVLMVNFRLGNMKWEMYYCAFRGKKPWEQKISLK